MSDGWWRWVVETKAKEGRSGLRRTKVRGGVLGEIRGIRAKKERGEAEMDAA